MDNNKEVLEKLNKGCTMGMEAITTILEKVDDYDFRDLLEKEYQEYMDFSNRIDELYRDISDDNLKDIGIMPKMMSWYSIQKDTILDSSNSKLADLLVNGTNMGIIEGRKLINNKKLDKKVHKLCCNFVKMQEKYIEKLKKYL